MRTYRRYIHCSQGVKEDENVIEIVFYYSLGGSGIDIAASKLLSYRPNLPDDKQLSKEQFEEYGAFIDHIDDLIRNYDFEVENKDDIHQSNESYSYYFKFTAIDKDGTYMDNHIILIRVSDHPQKRQSYKSLKDQSEESWGIHNRTLCDNIVIYPGNGKQARFSSVKGAYSYVDKLFDDLYNGKYYGMVAFPKGDARVPRPFNAYFDLVIPTATNKNLKYTYENAERFVDVSTMEPLGWAKPSPDSPESIKMIGDVLIVRIVDSNRLAVIAFNRRSPYILTQHSIE